MYILIKNLNYCYAGIEKKWILNGQIHRAKGAAIKNSNGEEWWVNGKRHRKDAPAMIKFIGEERWFWEGSLHRENGPAVKTAFGEEYWYFHGDHYIQQENGTKEFCSIKSINSNLGSILLHRDNDLPAVEYPNGDKEWWCLGIRHRLNGPAVIYGNKQFWFEFGEFIKCTVA